MALTRSMLKGMNLTEEQVGAIIDAHKETVDALKEQRDNYKADAEKLANVQNELDQIKNGEDWKGKYESEHKALEDYKREVAGRENKAKVDAAYRALLEGLNIGKEDVDLIMAATKTDDMKLDSDGKLENSDTLKEAAKTRYARYIPTTNTNGAKVGNPPKNNGNNGANPRAAEIARKFHERRYGVAPANDGANKNV